MWSIWLWVFPSWEVQVYLWMFRCGNIVLLTTSFFDVAKFTILTPLSLLSWCRLSFPIFGLKIFSLSTFVLILLIKFLFGTKKNDQKRALIPHKTVFWIIISLLTWCMHIQNIGIAPETSQNYIWHLIANKLSLLTADIIGWYTNIPVPTDYFLSFSTEKKL